MQGDAGMRPGRGRMMGPVEDSWMSSSATSTDSGSPPVLELRVSSRSRSRGRQGAPVTHTETRTENQHAAPFKRAAPRSDTPTSVRSTRSTYGPPRVMSSAAAPVRPILDKHYATGHAHDTEPDDVTERELDELSDAELSMQSTWERGSRAPRAGNEHIISAPYLPSVGSSSSLVQGTSRGRRDAPQFSLARDSSVTSLSNLARENPRRGMSRSSSTHSVLEGLTRPSFMRHSSREMLDDLLVRNGRAGSMQEGSALVAAQIASMLANRRITERYSKPIVSKFASYQQQFDPQASVPSSRAWTPVDDVPGRAVAVDVPESSVFSPDFVSRIEAKMAGTREHRSEHAEQYRYLLDYALSGPPASKEALSQVELMPQVENSMPLCTAGDTEQLVVPDSNATLGPNMIPFHFIHALTSAMENALALDHSEVPAMASLLPGVAVSDVPSFEPPFALDSEMRESDEEIDNVHYIDNHSMRAIACTAQAVAMQRTHTVTRRFADPLSESLERVARESGYTASLAAQEPPPKERARIPQSASLFGLSGLGAHSTQERGSSAPWSQMQRSASILPLSKSSQHDT